MRLTISILALPVAGVSSARVKRIERGKLASPYMTVVLGENGFASAYRANFVESRTAGGLPGSRPGGGCGCV